MAGITYGSAASTRSIEFQKGLYYYLTIVLSNSALSGNVFLATIEDLEADLQTEFAAITNLELRGVGCSMVRGTTDSLTLGISASYFTASTTADLTEAEATSLRTSALTAVGNVTGLTVSEIRVETNLIQQSTY